MACECAICTEELLCMPVEALPCGHLFHGQCIFLKRNYNLDTKCLCLVVCLFAKWCILQGIRQWEKTTHGGQKQGSCPICRDNYFTGNKTKVQTKQILNLQIINFTNFTLFTFCKCFF